MIFFRNLPSKRTLNCKSIFLETEPYSKKVIGQFDVFLHKDLIHICAIFTDKFDFFEKEASYAQT